MVLPRAVGVFSAAHYPPVRTQNSAAGVPLASGKPEARLADLSRVL
jgi:hypothetical protein